jgi:hypothetical integral membrane protein (TIGR02206 family)
MMDLFFSTAEVPAHAFILFGWAHLFMVLWVALFGFVLIRMGMKADEGKRKHLRWVLIVLFVIWEIEWQSWHIVAGDWTPAKHLPLHLCSAMIWVSIYGLLTRKRWVFALMYFFGIAGAIQALITPDSVYAFPHFRMMNTLFSHSLLVISGFWVIFVEGYRPRVKDIWFCFITLNVYAVPVYLLNTQLGSHYLYLGAKPETASVMDFFPDWPWYFPILQAILLLLMFAMYWPFSAKYREEAAALAAE